MPSRQSQNSAPAKEVWGHGGLVRVVRVRKKFYRRRHRSRRPYQRRRSGRKNVCFYCDRIIRELPYWCHRCGRNFCSEHRLPEAHACKGLKKRIGLPKPIKERPIWAPPVEPPIPIPPQKPPLRGGTIKKVRMRNGRVVDFDKDRITTTIFQTVRDQRTAEELSDKVVRILDARYAGRVPTLRDIHYVVGDVLAGYRKQYGPPRPREPRILIPPPPSGPQKPQELPRRPSIPEIPSKPTPITRPTKKAPSTKKHRVMLITILLIVGLSIASFFIYYGWLKNKSSISMVLSNNVVTFGENVYGIVRIISSDSSSPMPSGWVVFQVMSDNVTWDNYDNVPLSDGCCASKSYTPPAPGNYWFRTVYGGDANYNGSKSQVESLVVNKDRPVADFHWGNAMAYYDTQFFDDSIDRFGSIVSWSWNFGDSVSSGVKNLSHSYSEPGTYRISLTVTNDIGESDTCVKNIEILPWVGEDGESLDESVFAAGANGHTITLHNNPSARGPTWNELMTFLQQDTTDQIQYSYTSFVCADFAETLHNNAEKASIRAAYVLVTLSGVLHACNAFRTTDRGLVFIDDTNSLIPTNCDKQVSIVVGQAYIPTALFSSQQFWSMGTVNSYEIQW